MKPITLSPPAELMSPCEDLPKMQSPTNMGELVHYNITVINAYGACSVKLAKLQQWASQNS